MDPTAVVAELEFAYRAGREFPYDDPIAARLRAQHQAVTDIRLAMRRSPWTRAQLDTYIQMVQTRLEAVKTLNARCA